MTERRHYAEVRLPLLFSILACPANCPSAAKKSARKPCTWARWYKPVKRPGYPRILHPGKGCPGKPPTKQEPAGE